jgi:DNA invertase Pin-like site-specific DNA recombinase
LNTKTFAYLRASPIDSEIDKNRTDILFFANEYNLGKVNFVEENTSGAIHWKNRKLGSVIHSLYGDDNLIVSAFSQLGRSMLECLEIINFCLGKKVNLYAVKSNWRLNDSIQSKTMDIIFLIISEIERDLISKRTSEALWVRKQKGLPLGRPKGTGKSKLDGYKEEILAWFKKYHF